LASGTGFGRSSEQLGQLVQYALDAKNSQFRVHAFASGLISAVAHSPKLEIRKWIAEAEFVPATLERGGLRITIDPSGLELIDEVRESDRREIYRIMHAEVLESARFPQIVFEGPLKGSRQTSRDVYEVSIQGCLCLHGVTHSQAIDARVSFGDNTFRAHGEFVLFQSDYGINIASIGDSTLKLRDELKFSFFVVGRKKGCANKR
jgi:polyisoprenoid-binding protein YceI